MKRSSHPADCGGKEVAFTPWTPLIRGFQLLMIFRKNIRQVASMRKKTPTCRNLTCIWTLQNFEYYRTSYHILATVSTMAIAFFHLSQLPSCILCKERKKYRSCSNINYEMSSIIEARALDSSFHSGFYDRSTASMKPRSKQNVSPFNFQYPVSSLRSWSSCLRLLPCFPSFTSYLLLSFNSVF
jgi:hypothetical protein